MNFLSQRPTWRRRSVFFRSLLVVAGLSFAACSPGGSKDDDPNAERLEELKELRKEQTEIGNKIRKLEAEILAAGGKLDSRTPRSVEVLQLTPEVFNTYVVVQGKLEAEQDVVVGPEAPGTVTSVRVNEAQQVSKGSVLAQLDSRVLQQSALELKTQLDLATTLYNKQKMLWDQQIGSEVQYLSAKANKESLEQRMATLNQQLSMYTVRSPISGTVDEVNVKVGTAVAPGMPAFRVVNLSSLVAKAEVAESYGVKIGKGDEAVVRFPDLDKEVTGKVSFVARSIDPMSRSFTVEVSIKNDDVRYRPNMIATIQTVASQSDSALVVPVNAVQTGTDGRYVVVTKPDGKGGWSAQRTQVTLGDVYQGRAVITSGLQAGDRVVVKGYDGLASGQPITVQEPAAAQP